MSFALNAYIVDLPSLEILIKTQDKSLHKKMLAKYAAELDELTQLDLSEISPESALLDIIENHSNRKAVHAGMYAHLCELICDYLGERQNNSEWDSLSMSWLMDINLEAKVPFSLPSPIDFPYVLTIQNKDIQEFKETMLGLELESSAQNQFMDWVNQALKKNQDLVLFFY